MITGDGTERHETIERMVQYNMARLHRHSNALTGRSDFTFELNLSLQFYAQPFISADRCNHLKQIVDPVADGYTNHSHLLGYQITEVGFRANVNGDGTPEFISDPGFNFKQFRFNIRTMLGISTRVLPSSRCGLKGVNPLT